MLYIYHNSREPLYRTPFGAVETGTRIILRLAVRSTKVVYRVRLRMWKGKEEFQYDMRRTGTMGSGEMYQVSIRTPDVPGVLWYDFVVDEEFYKEHTLSYYGNNTNNTGGEGALFSSVPFQITIYKKGFTVPRWMSDGIAYQIFVDRFHRPNGIIKKERDYYYHEEWEEIPLHTLKDEEGRYSNRDFFGGNLYGVMEKLPYLSSLGVTVLYLNPIFDAYSNHKYDTGDYETVDQMFGGTDAFHQLVEKADEVGIRLILDGVFSHTGSDSRYFNKKGTYPEVGAYQSETSPYYPWYRFTEYPNVCESWWGMDTLPNVKELEPSYLEYMVTGENSIIRRWLRAGAGGWRLDVADELPEQFLKELYAAAKEENPENVVIGEVWEDASHKESYGELREYLLGEDMDSVMNYPLRTALLEFLTFGIPSVKLRERIESLQENYPREVFYSLLNMVGSHDCPRALTVLGDAPVGTLSRDEESVYQLSPAQREQGKQRLKLASLIQFTLPGLPCIYYGDEAGMEGMGDPFNRGPYPWGKEDEELLSWYRFLGELRTEHPVLQTGYLRILSTQEDVFAYVRYDHRQKDVFGREIPREFFLMIAYRGTHPSVATLFLQDCYVTQLTTLEGEVVAESDSGIFSLSLPPYGYHILKGLTR